MASCKLRSTSMSTSFEPPRNSKVQALGSSHSSRNAKYSSPNLRTSNRPALRPDVALLDFVRSTTNSGARRARDAVVVRLPQTSKRGNVRLHQVMLR